MNTKEPYFDNVLTTKTLLLLNANLLKIPPSTDYPVSTAEPVNTPRLRSSLRRGSMEPYYGSSRRGTMSGSAGSSKLSSYALLSDVFDYHYVDQYSQEDLENAIASDSDTDYEDLDVEYRGMSDSDADSELEDYKVHFLKFKVTSRAQFTRPPHRTMSNVSDHFDDGPIHKDFSMLSIDHHTQFMAPPLNHKIMNVGALDDLVSLIIANYKLKCNYPLNGSIHEQRVSQKIKVPKAAHSKANDEYIGAVSKAGTSSDAYDTQKLDYFL